MVFRFVLILVIFFVGYLPVRAQLLGDLPFLERADSLHPGRFWVCAGGGAVIYTGASLALWHAWYKDYDLGAFRFFDDWGEWAHMDKLGHVFTTYNEANWAYQGALWTGMPRRKAMWTGVGVSLLLQSTVEVMDGFSEKWGFSWYDMGFNLLGAGLFAAQEAGWGEQRMVFKISNSFPAYPGALAYSEDGTLSMPLDLRAGQLFGEPGYQRFLKDYNGMTIWLSTNVHAFLGADSRFPRWLNLAVGSSAENLYAGYGYAWETEGVQYFVNSVDHPRYGQFFLSPDIDLRRIPTRSKGLKTLFSVLNFLKFPAPALEVNTLGGVKFHPLHW